MLGWLQPSFNLVNNARTGIRTRVGASTGLHDRPLHYPDTSVSFAIVFHPRCEQNINAFLIYKCSRWSFSILEIVSGPASQTRTGDIAVPARKCTGNFTRTSRTTAAHSTTELRRDNVYYSTVALLECTISYMVKVYMFYAGYRL